MTLYALSLLALFLGIGCMVLIAGFWLRSLYESVEREKEEYADSIDQARKAATPRRPKLPLWLMTALLSLCVIAARAAVPAPHTIALADAPDGIGQWLTIAGFLLGLVIAAMQAINFIRGSKIQTPLEVRETLKFTSAAAMTRHCEKQDADLRRIEKHAEETIGEVRKELHNLGREVSDMNGRSELNAQRLERLEHLLTELLQRMSQTPVRPR